MNEIEEIEASAKRIRNVAKVIQHIFSVLFWCALLIMMLLFLMLIVKMAVPDCENVYLLGTLPLAKYVLEVVVVLLAIWVLKEIFQGIARSSSPFSLRQALLLRAAALLQVVHAAYVTMTSPAVLAIFGVNDAILGASVSNASSEIAARFIPINVGDIVLAIVLFCAALIVEYGSLLQKLSDDTL